MSAPLANTKLFQPLKVGDITVSNRIVYAPTTRFRTIEGHVPSDLQLEYYDKRSKYPGSLLIAEATFISAQAGLYEHAPGIWNGTQTEAWSKIVDAVHANKSFFAIQLWNLGRVGVPSLLKKAGLPFVAPSVVYENEESEKAAIEAGNPLRALSLEEIDDMINNQYVKAAENVFKAGFDILELHGAHGYMIDQFLQPFTNRRTDKYGGSIENRARFALEIIDLLSAKFGASKIAIRISPWAQFGGMKGVDDVIHPIATFAYFLSELQKRANEGKELAYISIVEPRVQGNENVALEKQVGNNDFIYQIWKGKVIRSGNYTYDAPHFTQIVKDTEDDRTLVGFARYYTSNPDLVSRLQQGLELVPYDRNYFYTRENYKYNSFPNYGEAELAEADAENKRVPNKIQ